MTQFSPTDASNTAMLIKKMIPNIDDVRLSHYADFVNPKNDQGKTL